MIPPSAMQQEAFRSKWGKQQGLASVCLLIVASGPAGTFPWDVSPWHRYNLPFVMSLSISFACNCYRKEGCKE